MAIYVATSTAKRTPVTWLLSLPKKREAAVAARLAQGQQS